MPITKLKGVAYTEKQVNLLNLLEPGFIIVKKRAFPARTVLSLIDRGLIEVKRGDYSDLIRLTKEGVEIRNAFQRRSAVNLSRKIWGNDEYTKYRQ